MTKRITISVSDELFNKLVEFKDEMNDKRVNDEKVSRRISSICQNALSEFIVEAKVSQIYRLAGVKDGTPVASSLSEKDKKFVTKVLSGNGPYKKWSRLEKVSALNDHFKDVTPRFIDLMDGKETLDAWVEGDSEIAQDRRGEMCWSYIEGCFEGIAKEIAKENKSTEI